MKNAVCYANEQELADVLNAVMIMPENEKARLRANVLEYYDRHLAPEHVVSVVQDFFSSDESTLRINIPYLESHVK